jgi:trans-2,3-dihydro-3-hydroxyanthranilate isomerase
MQPAKTFRYRVVDVFTEYALEGNPLAVFPDARGLSETMMQRIARELNLSETAFVLPSAHSDCVARVRIFTPAREMAFAGHPTVGTSHVLIEEGVALTDRFQLEEKIGKVPIRVERSERPLIWLQTPPIAEGNQVDRNVCAQSLGLSSGDLLDIPPQILSAGNPELYVALKDIATVDRAYLSSLGPLRAESDEPIGVFVFTPTSEGVYSRMFAPDHGVPEDPATGSATGPLAAYMIKHGLVSGKAGTRFVSEQGTKIGRRSILHVLITSEGIEVGGYVTPLVEATMSLTCT